MIFLLKQKTIIYHKNIFHTFLILYLSTLTIYKLKYLVCGVVLNKMFRETFLYLKYKHTYYCICILLYGTYLLMHK